MAVIEALIGVLFAGVGGFVVWQGSQSLRAWNYVRAGEPITVHEATRASGPVEIEGTVRPHEEPLESPFHGVDCVAYSYTIERRKRGGKNRSSGWRTVESGSERRPFVLEDGRETAYVDPEGATLSLESHRTRSIPNQQRARSITGVATSVFGGRRRYTEKRLEVGESVYVFGDAEAHPREVDADVAIEAGDAPVFLVSDASEGATRRRLLLKGLGLGAFGSIFLAVGLWLAAGSALGAV
ncbi:E3 ubiquitin ligase family protein [Natronobiforma cellulositropha]|uniref:E3 ubiquitin ligase family protein n=1 Tax=Natronobiforma cellulositropha TaxID=1679076 RepID=UPI0021D56CEF|nr:E3 ubiquitin ligase family protein [Natronobiforma cellulositropha]